MVIIFLLFFVFFITRNKSFTASFVGLSSAYFFIFYLYPLSFLIGESSFYYAGFYQNFNFDSFVFAAISGFLFVFGFFVPDVMLYLKNNKKRFFDDNFDFVGIEGGVKYRKIFWILLMIALSYYFLGVLDFNRAEKGYAIRTGEAQGSWLVLLLGLVAKSIFYSVLFVLLFLKKKKYAVFFLLLMLFYLLTGSTGRANLVFTIVLLFFIVFNFRLSRLIILSIIGVLVLLPLLVNMKHIIYSISVEGRFPNLYDIYISELDLGIIISNLGHPLVSLIKVDDLVDLVGFRYFYDYLHGFLFYFRALGLDFGDSLIYYNTENILGFRLSIIPTGYLAFGYVQLGYAGVILSGAFYRMIGYLSEYVFYKVNVNHEAVKFYFCYIAAATFYHGEIRVMVMTFFIPIFIVYFFRPERLTKRVI